jgi:hypothetical protein
MPFPFMFPPQPGQAGQTNMPHFPFQAFPQQGQAQQQAQTPGQSATQQTPLPAGAAGAPFAQLMSQLMPAVAPLAQQIAQQVAAAESGQVSLSPYRLPVTCLRTLPNTFVTHRREEKPAPVARQRRHLI